MKSRARVIIETYAVIFVARVAFPRLVDRLLFPTRFGMRALARRIAFDTLFVFAVYRFLFPALKRIVERELTVRGALREELGREPTQDELVERLLATRR